MYFINLFLLLLFSEYSKAQIPINEHSNVSINPFCYIISGSDTAKNNIMQEVDFGFNQKNGHTLFFLKNTSSTREYIIYIQQSRVDNVQLVATFANKNTVEFPKISKNTPFEKRPIESIDFCYKVTLPKNEIVKFDLYSQRKFGNHACVIAIKSIKNYHYFAFAHNTYISFVFGACFFIGLAGFFLFLFFRQKLYWIYMQYCFLNILLSMADAGYFHAFFPELFSITVQNNLTTNHFYLIVAGHILLTLVILEIKNDNHPILFYVGNASVLLFTFLGLMLYLPDLPFFLRSLSINISYYILFHMEFLILWSIMLSFKKKQLYVYFYICGFLFTLISTTILLLANIGVLDNINQNYDFGYAIPLVEIFFMLIGISVQFYNQNKDLQTSRLALLQTQKRVINIQDLERERIAKDLHDGIGQELLLFKRNFENQPAFLNTIEAIMFDLRETSRALYPVALKKIGLKNAIENLAEQIQESGIFFVSTAINYSTYISPETQLQIFRIVQEALNNAIKHAHAQAIRIELFENELNTLHICIKDNGLGFDVQSKKTTSFGLESMSERTKSLKGTFDIISSAKGTTINLFIPLNDV